MDLKKRFMGATNSCPSVQRATPWVTEKDAKNEDFDELVQLYEHVLGMYLERHVALPMYTDMPENSLVRSECVTNPQLQYALLSALF